MDETLDLVLNFQRCIGEPPPREPGFEPCPLGEGYDRYVQEALRAAAGDIRTLNDWVKRQTVEFGRDKRFLRIRLLLEEVAELAEAMGQDDLVGSLDALCDLRYLADGSTVSLGLQDVFMDAFREVHRSNMSKFWPGGAVRRDDDGKIRKPPTFSEPDLNQFIR